ncbi:MAG: class I SAM-dependent methyltransferase [Sandaracinaceae bacterium]
MELTAVKRRVPRRFDRVAGTYDLLTGLNPGYHRHLRASAGRLALGDAPRVLDLCCGTGSSTEAILACYPDARVTGLDASEGMLARARRKAALSGVRFVAGDATDPAASGVEGPFDGLLMAYGIRNLPDPDRALSNLLALLRPGGRAVFHEYSVADDPLRRAIWTSVCLGVIVPGGLLTGETELYRYLHRSVVAFDGVQRFEARLREAGFVDVWTGPMDGWQRGIVHSFVGKRPEAT